MSEESGKTTVLDYGRADRSLRRWLARLPRPSIWTVLLLIPAIAAGWWIWADHQPWVVERTFPQINTNGRLLTYEDKYLLIGTKRSSSPELLLGPFEVYDISTGERVSHFGESVWANDSAFSSDGERLVTRGGTYSTLNQHGGIHSLGEWSGGPKSICLWNIQTGDEIAAFGPVDYTWSETLMLPQQIHFSPDSQRLLILSGEQAMLYDADNGAPVAPLEQRDNRTETEQRQVIGDNAWFSPDSRFVVVKMRDPNPVRFWSAENGELVSEFMPGHSDGGQINGVFSPDSTTFALTDDGWLYLVDPATAALRTPPIELGEAHGVWFSPDGQIVVVWHDTPNGKMLTAVDARSGAVTTSMPQAGDAPVSHHFWRPQLRWSPDGLQAVLILRSNGIQARGSIALQPVATLHNQTPTRSFHFYSKNGSRVLMLNNAQDIEIRDTTNWRTTSIISSQFWREGVFEGYFLDAMFVGDTRRILTATNVGTVHLWRLRRPEAGWGIIVLPQFWVAAVAFLAFAVSAGRDLRRWTW